eukprot:CAMPEP_0185581950 /NCGR_PEP_ID=MMETSP0434-20130131/19413_1 /TAXON_ID=626734 ORGANISM="Favella taraikaensis, Strain Fe Narragansett Bay" /NCGR_SAMPLE_ID=MMETSP0434 /ASSEMBLY_ACC=CAM_ASM_000379 /LENGTH=32 /DNA_ID= /DNA_START= /DNA_END= /DNA_ORIENTATION=
MGSAYESNSEDQKLDSEDETESSDYGSEEEAE